MMLPKLSLLLVVLSVVVFLAEANDTTPVVRLCGRDFIRTVVRVCPDQMRRKRSLEDLLMPSSEAGQTEEKTKDLAEVLGLRRLEKAHRLAKRNVRMAERCCHHGCTIDELIESVCF